MFLKNVWYSIKMMIRQKDVLMWLLLFPIVLATVFYFAFANLGSTATFEKADIAVYNLESNILFSEVLAEVSNSGGEAKDGDMFSVTVVSEAEGLQLIKEGKTDGFIKVEGNNISLVSAGLDVNGTVVKTFIDTYLANVSTIQNNQAQALEIAGILRKTVDVESVPISKNKVEQKTTYFYALLGMVCFYFSMGGLELAKLIQPKQSRAAARQIVSPIPRKKIFLIHFCGILICAVFIIFVMLGYIGLVLGIPLGNFGFVLIACVIGMLASLGMGLFIGVLPIKNENIKNTFFMLFGLALSFLTGLMSDSIKQIIVNNANFINYINPVALISDSFHALYFYDGLKEFFIRIGILAGYGILFMGMSLLLIRRKKHAYI